MGQKYRVEVGSVTVPTGGFGNHRLLEYGEVFDDAEVPDWFRDKLQNDEFTSQSFSEAGKSDTSPEQAAANDPAVGAITNIEQVSKERSLLPPEERGWVEGGPEMAPPRLDDGRTLPESGADHVGATRWAEGSADTSEAGRDRTVQNQELHEAREERRSRRASSQQEEGTPRRKPGPKSKAEKQAEAEKDPGAATDPPPVGQESATQPQQPEQHEGAKADKGK